MSTAISADAVPIHYEVTGSGVPALVLVHGWSCDLTYWREQVDALGAKHRVVALDLAGHGDSGDGRATWDLQSFGSDVVAVVEQLDLGDVVLVGHSFGGDAVTAAAAHLGERVRGLVWVDTYGTLGELEDPAELEAFHARFLADFAGETHAFASGLIGSPGLARLGWVADDMASAPPATALAVLRVAIGAEAAILTLLPAMAGLPVIAINGGQRPSDEDNLAAHGVELEDMPGLGHFPMLEDPERFNELLEEVVARLPPR